VKNSLLVAISMPCSLPVTALYADNLKQPLKLIVQITVDALRGDLLNRYRHNFGPNGFNYLINNGVYYKNAHYHHGNTFKEYPPRQRAASFSLDQVMEKLQTPVNN